MPKPKDTLDRLNINTPCTADWDEMVGNDEVRFCRHCDLSVHNLSTMTRQEALRLVISSNGKLCVRYVHRSDGGVHTTDLLLPKLHSIKRRASRLAATAFTAALSVSTSVVAAAPARPGSSVTSPIGSTLVLKRANSSSPLGTAGASVRGVVKDQEGAVIPGVTVTLTNEANGAEFSTTTDDEGMFRLQTIDEGSFRIKFESPGFGTKELTNFILRANDEQVLDETLDVSAVMMGGMSISAPSEPLVAAAAQGDLAAVKELLATGADVDVVDEGYDSTALSQAVSNGNGEVVVVLINAGADVNLKNHSGHTAVMAITGSTTAEIVKALIDAGAKIDLRDEDGKNVMHYVAGYAQPYALQALLQGGISVDARDKEDKTALMIAASAGNSENVAALLKAGATVNLRDEFGMTALGLALENDFSETAQVLRDFGAME